jgi:hypothetical protein
LALRALARRSSRHVLQTQFATAIEPDGPLAECKIRFPIEEADTPCLVRAMPAGWYMASSAELVAKLHWTSGVPYLKQPVLIPWGLLEYRLAKFPLRRWLRFDIPSAKVTFFVRRSVATAVLREAGRPLPPE